MRTYVDCEVTLGQDKYVCTSVCRHQCFSSSMYVADSMMLPHCRKCSKRFMPAIFFTGQSRRTCCNGCKYHGACCAGCTIVAPVPSTPVPITPPPPIENTRRRDSADWSCSEQAQASPNELAWQSPSTHSQMAAGDDAPREETSEVATAVADIPSSEVAIGAPPCNKTETSERDTGEGWTSGDWSNDKGWGGGWSGKQWSETNTWSWTTASKSKARKSHV